MELRDHLEGDALSFHDTIVKSGGRWTHTPPQPPAPDADPLTRPPAATATLRIGQSEITGHGPTLQAAVLRARKRWYGGA